MSDIVVFDIEADNLLDKVSRLWVLRTQNIHTGEKRRWILDDHGWMDYLSSCKAVIGHNIIGYDLAALKKLFGWVLPKSVEVRDTLLLSQLLDYRRFGHDGHSLDRWGQHLGFPKIHFDDFSQYSEEMDVYCERDVELNVKVYLQLVEEIKAIAEKSPQIRHYIKAEHAVSKWCAAANEHGWPFDLEGALTLATELEDTIKNVEEKLQVLLGLKAVAKDKCKGVVAIKEPKWNLNGNYKHHTANWFQIDASTGMDEDRLVEGPFCRVEFVPRKLSSVSDVKDFLYENGWVPTEWNRKRNEITGKFENTSPKITDDSLELLGGDGALYRDYSVASSRYSILKNWIAGVDDNGRVHGDCMTIGTPSMRMRHSGIVNVPSVDAPWGIQMRKLFRAQPGWVIIGCDSSGNQARGLAHYLQSEDYIDLLLNGDVHTYNAEILTNVLRELGFNVTVPRSAAKRALYATLFGASGGKLFLYCMNYIDARKGNKLKKGFLKAVPGFDRLMKQLERIYGHTSKSGFGWIPGIAGNRIYVDSFHKLLVYLLQACEKATCGAAVMYTMEELERRGIPYIPLIMMHDEEQFMVPEEYAEEAKAIGANAFKEAPKLFGITIMDGEGKIGQNWYETH